MLDNEWLSNNCIKKESSAGSLHLIVLKNPHMKTSMPPISIPTPKSTLTPPEEKTIVFDIAVAEVICRKDNAEVLKKTIEPALKKVIEAITNHKLTIGALKCCFGNLDDAYTKVVKESVCKVPCGRRAVDLCSYERACQE
eukprot:scaffold270636_cov126-Cyclotella_meneghiniana.AAC.2